MNSKVRNWLEKLIARHALTLFAEDTSLPERARMSPDLARIAPYIERFGSHVVYNGVVYSPQGRRALDLLGIEQDLARGNRQTYQIKHLQTRHGYVYDGIEVRTNRLFRIDLKPKLYPHPKQKSRRSIMRGTEEFITSSTEKIRLNDDVLGGDTSHPVDIPAHASDGHTPAILSPYDPQHSATKDLRAEIDPRF